mmetsp:Transcript_2196/g.6942  ORF Transcript_2196/g.6942 Transcript_2196/m.6942 type:complete len:224 (-) Transcript_2196:1977-2648(-)
MIKLKRSATTLPAGLAPTFSPIDSVRRFRHDDSECSNVDTFAGDRWQPDTSRSPRQAAPRLKASAKTAPSRSFETTLRASETATWPARASLFLPNATATRARPAPVSEHPTTRRDRNAGHAATSSSADSASLDDNFVLDTSSCSTPPSAAMAGPAMVKSSDAPASSSTRNLSKPLTHATHRASAADPCSPNRLPDKSSTSRHKDDPKLASSDEKSSARYRGPR